jgi:O-antigen ligase
LQLLGHGNTFTSNESRYIHSREDAAHLAVDLFIQNPLTGIGWEQFTHYSQTRLHYGALATHNEYLRYAAELGLPGLLFLVLIIATVAKSAIRIRPTDVRVAAVACLVSGAVGLCFLNGLETPTISLPLFVSAALICARSVGQPFRRKV